MSKHTPGPWYVGRGEHDQSRHVYAATPVVDADGDSWRPLIAATDDDERLVNFEANARLIASAPELLEALEKLDSYFRSPGDDDWLRFLKEVLEPARAAITKAKGEK